MEILSSDCYKIIIDPQDLILLNKGSLTVKYKEGDNNPYVYVGQELLHRLVMCAEVGVQVDHRDGNTFDNRRQNLRAVHNRTNSQNTVRRREGRTSSKYLGVHFNKESRALPWRTRSYKNKKQISLGSYANEHEAALVYNIFQLENFNLFEMGGLNLLGESTTPLS